ncbi:MAG: YceD family protein [Spongiibacteraceae bacterium]
MADPLPKLLDVRKFIAANIELHASEPLKNFGRLRDMLESPADESEWGDVDIRLHLFVDAQGKRRIDGDVQAAVLVTCQRCLQPMPLTLDSQFAVAAVWTDEDAEHLPKHLDAFIVGEGLQDVRPLIEDELIISLPYASYHELEDCAVEPYRAAESNDDGDVDAAQPEAKENPFKVLELLKPGK